MWIVLQILFLVAAPCVFVFLWKAIQEDQMFGKWRKVLEYLYGKGYTQLSLFLGYCNKCFAHFVSWLMFGINVACTYDMWPIGDWRNIFYALLFVTVSWRLCLTQLNHLD